MGGGGELLLVVEGLEWKWKKRSSLGWNGDGLLLLIGGGGGGGGVEVVVVVVAAAGVDLWLRIHSVALRVDLPPVAAKAWAANSSGKPILSSCSISISFSSIIFWELGEFGVWQRNFGWSMTSLEW